MAQRPPKLPADLLRDVAAPREVVEWVRKMPAVDAPNTAWSSVPRAEWLPYLATLRGFDHEAIVRAACSCALDLMEASTEPEHERVNKILADAAEHGRKALAPVEAALEDLRLKILAHGTQPPLPWMLWAKLVLELARTSRRGNALIGVSLALRMLVDARGRRANTELITRFRDKLPAPDAR